MKWRTVDAHATAPGDYTAVAPSLVSFAPGETTKTVAVTIKGDTAVEPEEDFYVRLDVASGASVADGSGLGRIVNDDTASLSVNDVTILEGDVGTRVATFTISRTGALAASSSVKWATADGTATAPSDYVATALTNVSFAPGETTKTASVTLSGDSVVEPNEVFYLARSAHRWEPSSQTVRGSVGSPTTTQLPCRSTT